jgi:hypothetical protein|tara:strand:+ start:114 stop:374 length:261 start_codon:yes stop_codon:yes gene_type:complete
MKLKKISLNETEILLNEKTPVIVFFSYNTPVAAKVGVKYYRTEEKHSPTTSKHLNRWLEDVKCELRPQSWFENRLNWNPESFLCKS